MAKDKLEQIRASVIKKFGDNAVTTSDTDPLPCEAISTGSFLLDSIIGVGGFPKARIVELYGAPGGGKTSVSLLTIAELQRNGGIAAFIDLEHALTLDYAQQLGVNPKTLLLVQPDSADEGFSIAETMVEQGIDLVVIDSIAAIITKEEIEREIWEREYAPQAKFMAKVLRRLTPKVSKSNCCLICINQTRMKMGNVYGDPEETPGGKALKFYASLRMRVNRSTSIKDEKGVPYGDALRIKVVKNKVAPPYRECQLNMIWGKGYEERSGVIELAVNNGIISNPKQGSYILPDKTPVRGFEALKLALDANPTMYASILTELKKIPFGTAISKKAEPKTDEDGNEVEE